MRGTAESYRVFIRNWWRRAKQGEYGWPNQLVPDHDARKTILATNCTREEAIRICEEYTETRKPSLLCRMAEFEKE